MRAWKKRNREKVNEINRKVKAAKPELYKKINRESATRVRRSDPAKAAQYHRDRKARHPEAYLVNHARLRASRLGVPFSLVEGDVIIPEFCPVLGTPLKWNVGQRASSNRSSPSLDRVIPELGYVKGNVVVISNRANHLKNNASPEELRLVADYAAREHARVVALLGP